MSASEGSPLAGSSTAPASELVDLLYNQGVEHARAERWALAEDRLRLAVALHPSDLEARVLLGKVLAHQQRRAEAATCLREALRIDPGNAPARAALRRLEQLDAADEEGAWKHRWLLAGAAPLLLAAGYLLGRRRGGASLLG